MKLPHAMQTLPGAFGRCALVGMLAGLLATPTFALGGPAVNHENSQPNANTLTLETSDASANLPLISTDSTATDTDLVSAPEPTDVASSVLPPRLDLMVSSPDAAASSTTNNNTTPKKHHLRPGMLVMGIAGAGLAGFGAYIFSINTGSNSKTTGLKDSAGTLFLAPGAAMAGLGFYFAFK